jgi:hypothetical protein
VHRFGGVIGLGLLIALAAPPPALAFDSAPAPPAQSPNVATGGGMTGTSTGAVARDAPNSAAGGGTAPSTAAPPPPAPAPTTYVARPVVTVPVAQSAPRAKPARHRAKRPAAHRVSARPRARANRMSASAERAIAPSPKPATGVESASPTTQVASGIDLTPYLIVLSIVAGIGIAIAVLRRELPEA